MAQPSDTSLDSPWPACCRLTVQEYPETKKFHEGGTEQWAQLPGSSQEGNAC